MMIKILNIIVPFVMLVAVVVFFYFFFKKEKWKPYCFDTQPGYASYKLICVECPWLPKCSPKYFSRMRKKDKI